MSNIAISLVCMLVGAAKICEAQLFTSLSNFSRSPGLRRLLARMDPRESCGQNNLFLFITSSQELALRHWSRARPACISCLTCTGKIVSGSGSCELRRLPMLWLETGSSGGGELGQPQVRPPAVCSSLCRSSDTWACPWNTLTDACCSQTGPPSAVDSSSLCGLRGAWS